MEFAGLSRSFTGDDDEEIPDSEDEEAIERRQKRRRISPKADRWLTAKRQETLTQMQWPDRNTTIPDSEDEEEPVDLELPLQRGAIVPDNEDEDDVPIELESPAKGRPDLAQENEEEPSDLQPQTSESQRLLNDTRSPDIRPQPVIRTSPPHGASPGHLDAPSHNTTPKPKTPKRVRIAEVPSSQSPDVTPISIRFIPKETTPVSPQSPTRKPKSTQPEAASLNTLNTSATNNWTQTQTTPITRKKVMDFNARWAELSKSPSYGLGRPPVRTAARRQVEDQNTFALGEETQAALLEAEATIPSSDIYSDDEILGDPEEYTVPPRVTASVMTEKPTMVPALKAAKTAVHAEPVTGSAGRRTNQTSVTQQSASNGGVSKSRNRPIEAIPGLGDASSGAGAEDTLEFPSSKLAASLESQARTLTCAGDTNAGDGLPQSSPPGATSENSLPRLPAEYGSLGRQLIEDSQDLPDDPSSDELTLSQLMAGSLMNSSIPRPPAVVR
jgi:hypothetical protein